MRRGRVLCLMPASGWSRGRSRRLALRRLTLGRGAPLRAPLRRETGSGVRRGRVLCPNLVTGGWRGGPPASPPGRHEALGMLLPSLRSGAALALFAVKLMSTPACASSRPGVGKGRPLPTPGHACPRLPTPGHARSGARAMQRCAAASLHPLPLRSKNRAGALPFRACSKKLRLGPVWGRSEQGWLQDIARR